MFMRFVHMLRDRITHARGDPPMRGATRIQSSEQCFQLIDGPSEPVTVSYASIRSVAVFKRDELTTDMLWLRIEFDADSEVKTLDLHEDIPGFLELVSLLESHLTLAESWRQRVLQPAFRTNFETIYQRAGICRAP